MLRPVEWQLSYYNVEQKAPQARDLQAAVLPAAVRQEAAEEADRTLHQVQESNESEGEVRVKDREEREGGSGGSPRGRKRSKSEGKEAEGSPEEDGRTGLNLLA
jgi:hypothetical protein